MVSQDLDLSEQSKNIDEIIDRADKLLESLKAARKGKSSSVNFRDDYLSWYIEARQIVADNLPEMLSEFDSLYNEPNRTAVTEATYCIRDYILLTFPPRDPKFLFQRWFNEFHPTYMRMYQQLMILMSCKKLCKFKPAKND